MCSRLLDASLEVPMCTEDPTSLVPSIADTAECARNLNGSAGLHRVSVRSLVCF
jgi:hypothetical protein